MSHTISDVQRGEATRLQRCIDNCEGRLYIGLRSITFAVGWYNIEQGETFSWRSAGVAEETLDIEPGLYWFDRLKKLLNEANATPNHTLEVNKVNGLITLTVSPGMEILLSDGLLELLGLDDGLGGTWLTTGVYVGDRPINFAKRQVLWVHLDEISTTENTVDGNPSTLLSTVGVGDHSFGDIRTVNFSHPEYKRLRPATFAELNVSIRDKAGKIIQNHGLPIDVSLDIVDNEYLRLQPDQRC